MHHENIGRASRVGTRIQFGVVVLALLLILPAPWATGQGMAEVVAGIRSELSPFP